MPDVWVKDKKTGHQYRINEAVVDSESHTVMKKEPITNLDGSPRLPVYSGGKNSGDTAATSGQTADTTKEK